MVNHMRLQLQSPHWDSLPQNLLLLCLLLGLRHRPPQMMRTLTSLTCLMNLVKTTVPLRRRSSPIPLIHRTMGTFLISGVCVILTDPLRQSGITPYASCTRTECTTRNTPMPCSLGNLLPTPLPLSRITMMHTVPPTPTRPTCVPSRESLVASSS